LTAWRSSAALALLQTGLGERARELADEELEIARAFGRPYPLGVALRVAAVVRRDEALLLEAVEVLRDSPARLEYAKALCELGALRRRMGRRTEARDPLLRALDLASRCGARPVAERARSELVAVGARPRRDRLAGRHALTAAELRVARLAAEGRTNRDIAQALFLTLRTVETHLTSTYRKLDIASRTQLAGALAPASGDL
jgi:DNA-binding CsgD family transcriptional regulator